jgi:predicted GTPase
MNFKKQISELKIVTVTKPRVYLQWANTEKGRDKHNCYERVEDVYIRYINTHNPSMVVIQGDKFFKDFEEMYKRSLNNKD